MVYLERSTMVEINPLRLYQRLPYSIVTNNYVVDHGVIFEIQCGSNDPRNVTWIDVLSQGDGLVPRV
jgi:hypothetical protein